MLVRRLRLDGVRLAKTTTTHELVEQAGPLLVEHVIGSRVELEHARGAHQPLVEPVEQTEPVEEASRRRERGVAGPLGARRADAVEAQGRKVGAKGGRIEKSFAHGQWAGKTEQDKRSHGSACRITPPDRRWRGREARSPRVAPGRPAAIGWAISGSPRDASRAGALDDRAARGGHPQDAPW